MRYSVLALTLCTLLFGLAAAQGTASHTVTISIPVVLRLSLEGGQTKAVPLQVEVANHSYRITPRDTVLKVFANSDWRLLVSYQGDPLALTWQLGDRSGRLRSYPQVLTGGEATRGWRPLTVSYALAQLPADGRYQGLVIYTLTRP
ncbi:MAG: hypothetical protein KGZ60_00185 [Truepera sp.]|nr:hypothetical protein [Truepera sp.]